MNTASWVLHRPMVLAIAGTVAIAGLAAGGTALAATDSHSSNHQPGSTAAAPQAAHVFARNARGQTYGSELDATDLAHAPDLIAAYATNGQLGYVLKRQLHPPGPRTPAAALRAQAEAAKQAPAQIPVYAVDGITQIGVLAFGPAVK